MFNRLMRVCLLTGLMLLVAAACAAEPKLYSPPKRPGAPTLPELKPEQLADPKAAAAAADDLEKEYKGANQPEAVKMLVAILRGSQMGPRAGWFAPGQSRFTWELLAQQYKVDPKEGSISLKEFHGPASLFKRLDRDGDGSITAGDLDWSDRNGWTQQAYMVNRMFRRINSRGDGKLTREDLDAFFNRASDGKEFLTSEDLREALLGGSLPGDNPTIPMLVRGLYTGEVGSLNEGPRLGDDAPAFSLKTVDGKETIELAKLIGPKPIVLVFGNFTCGPFRSFYPDVELVYQRYKNDAHFVMVYVREAHPTDGWKMESNTKVGVAVKQPTEYGERVKVCDQFCQKLKPTMPVVVDDIDDATGHAYSGMPARMYLIDPKGKVAYKSGRGPFGFKVGEMEQMLALCLLEARGSDKLQKPVETKP